jgi:1-acyl-sn-glycerol-3-phosphate acyltransferase
MIASVLRALFTVLFTLTIATVVILTCFFPASEKWFFVLTRFYSRIVLSVCGIRVVLEGSEHVDFSRSHIFVANHASLFDIPAAIAGIPDNIRIVYRKDLERIPIFGWGLHVQKTFIGIDRGNRHDAMHTIEEAARKIARGGSVLMFGEGTRTRDGKLQQFKRGPFKLAARAGVPVVPLTINGSFGVLPRGSLHIHPGTITLVVDQPIKPPPSNGREPELDLRDRVRATIERHHTET